MLLKGALSAPFCLVRRSGRVNVQVTATFLFCIYVPQSARTIEEFRYEIRVRVTYRCGLHRVQYHIGPSRRPSARVHYRQ